MGGQHHESEAAFLRKRLTRRDVIRGGVGIAAAASVAPFVGACGDDGTTSPSESPTGSVAPKAGGNLRVGESGGSSKESLDAHKLSATASMEAFQLNLYDPLLEYSPEGKIENALAEEVQVNSTATQFTVRLKPDLTFHNGKPVTADDVVYTFARILDPKDPGLGAEQLIGLPRDGVKKVDTLTARFELTQPNAVFTEALAAYCNGIVPVDYAPQGASGAIGAGPFMDDKFLPGQQAVFVRNPNYWREVYPEELTILEFADPAARMNALLGEQIDYLTDIPTPQVDVVQNTSGLKTLEAKTGFWIPFTMRVDVKPFSDVRVRQAFRLIVDREEMLTNAYSGYGWIGNDMYAPFDPAYPKDLPQREQNLDEAKSLLKAAGYEGLDVELMTWDSVSSTAPAAAQVFAEQAKGAGVTVKVRKLDSNIFWGDQYLKWPFAMDYWTTRNYLPQTAMGTQPNAQYNETHWDSVEWLALVREAFRTADETRRNEPVAEASTIEYNEGGYIIWAFNTLVDGFSDKVTGAVPDVSGLAGAACKARFRLVHFV